MTRSSVATISAVSGCMLAVRLPEVPRPEVHQRVGEERGGVEVVGEALRHLAHGVGVRAVERGPVGRRRHRVPLRERLDDRALALRDAAGQDRGLLDGREGGLLPLGVGRAVVVRAVGQRDAPVAHRAGRIEAGRLAERAFGLDVVEGVHESQPLVEVGLGLTRGRRNGLVVAPEALQEHGWRGRVTPGLMVGRRLRRAGGESERERSQDRADRTSHLTAPSLPHRKANVPAGVPHGLAAVRGPCARRDSASTDRERDCPSTPAGSPPRRYDCGSRPRPPAAATPVGGWRTRPGAACRAAEQPRIAASTP